MYDVFTEYYFVNREKMQEMVKNNELIEHTEFAGNIYGTRHAFNSACNIRLFLLSSSVLFLYSPFK